MILFEDKHLVVVDKPAGWLSQGGEAVGPNLVDFFRERWGRPYVGLVHRLDRNVSGAMVVAKRTKAARRLTEQLQSGKLVREYEAWVWGNVAAPANWRHFLSKDERSNTVRVVGAGQGKLAELSVVPLRSLKVGGRDVTQCRFRLGTGRSHQIRVQCQAQGHSICGDVKYGGGDGQMMLRSVHLEFDHPMEEGKRMVFEAELPASWGGFGS